MHKLFLVSFQHDGVREVLAFFAIRSHAEDYADSLSSRRRFRSVSVEEIYADFFEA